MDRCIALREDKVGPLEKWILSYSLPICTSTGLSLYLTPTEGGRDGGVFNEIIFSIL